MYCSAVNLNKTFIKQILLTTKQPHHLRHHSKHNTSSMCTTIFPNTNITYPHDITDK